MQPRSTKLDTELSFIARTPQDELDRIASVPLSVFGEMGSQVGRVILEQQPVSLKLIVAPGCEEQAIKEIGSLDGLVVSAGPVVLLAEIPSQRLNELNNFAWLRRAEAPRQLRPSLDEARGSVTGADEAVRDFGLDGQGTVLGIVDSGVDWKHEDFQDNSGNTRLEYFAHAHMSGVTSRASFDEFDGEAINEATSGKRHLPLGDPNGHGTHCLSIAAGNGRASKGRFRGIASQAILMAVRADSLLDVHVIRGIREIFRKAGKRPAVINLSLGGHLGPHDGTSAIEKAVAAESGPGRIVVVAAGNAAQDQIHWQGELQNGKELVIPFQVTDVDSQYLDVWVARGDDVDILIETPDGAQTSPNGIRVDTVFGSYFADWRTDPANHDQNLTLRIWRGRLHHKWKVRLKAQDVLNGIVHAWGGTGNPATAAQVFVGSSDAGYSLGMPGTEERAITVASFVSRTSFTARQGSMDFPGLSVGQLSPFSSWGPNRYGAMKPNIAAPGQYITAALASGSMMANDSHYTPRHDPSGHYITIQGTSMAAPFVAGVIALMLEREPTLTPEEIQQRLRITARRDKDTGRVWSSGFGFGKIDVPALLQFGQK